MSSKEFLVISVFLHYSAGHALEKRNKWSIVDMIQRERCGVIIIFGGILAERITGEILPCALSCKGLVFRFCLRPVHRHLMIFIRLKAFFLRGATPFIGTP